MTEHYEKIINLYIQSTKHFIELSSAALALSVIFREKILGFKESANIGWLLIGAWLAFLCSIGFGILYEYLAIHFLSLKLKLSLEPTILPIYFEKNPGVIYGAMTIFFFLGAVLLLLSGLISIREKRVKE